MLLPSSRRHWPGFWRRSTKKIEKATKLCGTGVDDLVDIDASAERMLAAITRLELAIQLKLDLFSECRCPDTPCSGTRTTCGK